MFKFIMFLLSFFSIVISIMGFAISIVIGTNWIIHIVYILISGCILWWSVNNND